MDPPDQSTFEKLHSALGILTNVQSAAINAAFWKDLESLKNTIREGQGVLWKVEQGIEQVQKSKSSMESAQYNLDINQRVV